MTVRQRVIGSWRSRRRIFVIFSRNQSWRFWNDAMLPQNAGSGYFVTQHHIPEKQNPLNHTSSWRNWGRFARKLFEELCGVRKDQGSSFDISELQWSYIQCGGWEECLQGVGRNASRRVLVGGNWNKVTWMRHRPFLLKYIQGISGMRDQTSRVSS
jgi:hypothetical protein